MKQFVSLALALSVTTFTGISHAQDVTGNANAGAQKIAMCIGCHGISGYQASFPEVYKVPKISGQGAKYISAALTAYKKGERKHPTMRSIADSLSDQDIADVAAYYSEHGKVAGETLPEAAKAPSASTAALLAKGGCTACHGANFAKPIDPSYPKIAGQHADYLFVALKSYKVEGASTWGRGNAIMGGVAKQYSNAELKELANYVASQQGDLKTVPQSRFR
jgi:cytochrome c553